MTATADDRSTTGAMVSAGTARYGLGLLLLIYVFNFLDRQIVTILAEPIKNDLGLADWQLGVLTGLSFALLYTLLGFPVARLSERGDRPLIIATAVGVWSLFTVACGMTQNFVQLLLARVGVGIGEAGCTPPAISLIADYVPKARRGRTMAIYTLGGPLGGLLGMVMGGLAADAWGWRTAFLIAGGPGLIMAVVAALTLAEPRRALKAKVAAKAADAPGLRDAAREILGSRALVMIITGGAMKSLFTYGLAAFLSSFFFRNHGEELARIASGFGLQTVGFVGIAMGVTLGVSGMTGTYIGGYLTDRFGARDKRAYAVIPGVGILAAVPLYLVALSIDGAVTSLLLLTIPQILSYLWPGPIYAMVQGLVRPGVRATAAAVQLFTANLVGLGLGPVCIGIVSDFYANNLGYGSAEGLRLAIMTFALSGIPAGLLFIFGAKTLREEMVN